MTLTNNTAKTLIFPLLLILGLTIGGNAQAQIGIAYFSGGCFWCTEHDFEKINGVKEVISGYMGGHVENPTYEAVASGRTGHYEVVQVIYVSDIVGYQNLLSAFWRMHDPSDGEGSFCDRGQQYSTAAFYADDNQKKLLMGAIEALNAAGKFNRPVATKILPQSDFTPAEAYHQDYASRNPVRYRYYRHRCGRDQFISKTWAGDDRLYQSEQ
ncbi:MAG: peptide-methionine (S)-S-oxide reductase MsrA [Parvibaculales bacterium]